MIVECVKVVYLIYQLTTNTKTMVHLTKSNKKNILALTEKIKEQKIYLRLFPEDTFMQGVISMNERTLEFLISRNSK